MSVYLTIEHGGYVWDVSDLATDISWSTDTNFAAGTLTFDLLEINEGFTPANGDKVEFKWAGKPIFKGKIFKNSYTSDEIFTVTAYDNLRYLKNEDMIVWGVDPVVNRFNRIMRSIGGIPTRAKCDSQIRLIEEIQDGSTYFSVLADWAKEIKRREGLRLFVRDVFGTVELVAQKREHGDFLTIGDSSLATGWKYERSVDDMYNMIKLVRETRQDDQRSIYTTKSAQSAKNREKYGPLQKVEKADDKLNDAQMQDKVNQLLKEHNREARTFSIKAIGDISMRAGERFYLDVDSLRDIGVGSTRMFATSVTHEFGAKWIMNIEMEVD